jgi:hypothetical protein
MRPLLAGAIAHDEAPVRLRAFCISAATFGLNLPVAAFTDARTKDADTSVHMAAPVVVRLLHCESCARCAQILSARSQGARVYPGVARPQL